MLLQSTSTICGAGLKTKINTILRIEFSLFFVRFFWHTRPLHNDEVVHPARAIACAAQCKTRAYALTKRHRSGYELICLMCIMLARARLPGVRYASLSTCTNACIDAQTMKRGAPPDCSAPALAISVHAAMQVARVETTLKQKPCASSAKYILELWRNMAQRFKRSAQHKRHKTHRAIAARRCGVTIHANC